MKTLVDARGFSCPQPVLMARQAIEKGAFPIDVWVDSVTSRENVRRMAEMNNCKVEIESAEDEFHVVLTRD